MAIIIRILECLITFMSRTRMEPKCRQIPMKSHGWLVGVRCWRHEDMLAVYLAGTRRSLGACRGPQLLPAHRTLSFEHLINCGNHQLPRFGWSYSKASFASALCSRDADAGTRTLLGSSFLRSSRLQAGNLVTATQCPVGDSLDLRRWQTTWPASWPLATPMWRSFLYNVSPPCACLPPHLTLFSLWIYGGRQKYRVRGEHPSPGVIEMRLSSLAAADRQTKTHREADDGVRPTKYEGGRMVRPSSGRT